MSSRGRKCELVKWKKTGYNPLHCTILSSISSWSLEARFVTAIGFEFVKINVISLICLYSGFYYSTIVTPCIDRKRERERLRFPKFIMRFNWKFYLLNPDLTGC